MDVANQSSKVKTVCIIVAGGKGLRLGGGEPKQFLPLSGRPLIVYAISHFAAEPVIDEIMVVVPEGWENRAKALMMEAGIAKGWTIVTGGERRQDSVLAGVKAAGECEIVVVHDGARPFPPEGLTEALGMVEAQVGVIFAIPVTDSIKAVDGNGKIVKTVPRDGLWGAQTPQMFRREELLAALQWCDDNGIEITDDASAFEKRGWSVRIVDGVSSNIKVTFPEDFKRAELLLKEQDNV